LSRFDDSTKETLVFDLKLLKNEDNPKIKLHNYFCREGDEINRLLGRTLIYRNNSNFESYYNVSYQLNSGEITIIYGLSGNFYRDVNSIEDAIQSNESVEHSFNESVCKWFDNLGFDFSETNDENNCTSMNKIMNKCNDISKLKAWFTPPCNINEPCLQYIFSKNNLLNLTK
jgi:hypothetical protein